MYEVFIVYMTLERARGRRWEKGEEEGSGREGSRGGGGGRRGKGRGREGGVGKGGGRRRGKVGEEKGKGSGRRKKGSISTYRRSLSRCGHCSLV